MADENTSTATAADPQNGTQQQDSAPATDDAGASPSNDGGATETSGQEASGSISDDLLNRVQLLDDYEPEQVDEVGETTDDEPEQPGATMRRAVGERGAQPKSRTATEAAGPVSFDAGKFTKTFVDQFGDAAGPAAEQIASTFTGLLGEIEDLRAQLADALGVKDEFGKFKQDLEPVRQQVSTWQTAEQRQVASNVHDWFDKQEGFKDRYGSGDPRQHSPAQKAARQTVFNKARLLLNNAKAAGDPLTLAEALQGAQYIKFRDRPTRAGAVAEVRGQVKRAARGISPDPARGGSKSGQPETPEQERARSVKNVGDILRRAASGSRT